MWNKLVSACIICAVLFGVSVDSRPVYSNENDTSSRSQMRESHVKQILAQGSADDEIPVIVTLQSPSFARSLVQSPLAKQQRINAVRMIQQDFARRYASYMRFGSRQPRIFPVMAGMMRRSDVRILAGDSQVVSIKQDELATPTMDVSSVLIGSYAANVAGVDGRGTSVAVLDTGVLTSHEFLSGKVVAEACFSNVYGIGTEWYNGTSLCPSGSNTTITSANQVGSAAPCVGISGCDHGTHVAGTVAGKVINKGSYELRGVAPAAKIIGIQVFTNFSGSIGSWGADQLLAMEWLLEHMDTPEWGDLAALNMSIGGGSYDDACDVTNGALKVAIDELRGRGVATVIASGNNGYLTSISGPACISSAIAVGSTTTSSAIGSGGVAGADEISAYSNAPAGTNNALNVTGDRLLDLLAPGHFIWSSTTTATDTYGYKAGTSMAAPHVAGAWALLKQVAADASVTQMLEWFRTSGVTLTDIRPGTDPYILRYAITPTPAPSATSALPFTLLYADRASLSLPRIQVNNAVSTAVAAVTDTPIPTNTIMVSTSTSTPTITPVPLPGAFAKAGPANNSRNLPLTVTATWGASSGASHYEYCLSTAAATCSRWTNVGTARSVVLRGLASGRTYYWNVRAVNTHGATLSNSGAWRFTTTTQALPGAFAKIAPANGLGNRPLNTALTWNASAGATRYEYCLATSAAACTNWKSVGAARVVAPAGLVRNRTYYWQVRAVNTAGETVSVGGVWRFTTIR